MGSGLICGEGKPVLWQGSGCVGVAGNGHGGPWGGMRVGPKTRGQASALGTGDYAFVEGFQRQAAYHAYDDAASANLLHTRYS